MYRFLYAFVKSKDPYCFHPNIIRTMKVTFVILLSFCLHVSAKSYSQKITLSAKNMPLEKVFKIIKKQSGYSFFYDHSLLKNAAGVNISVVNQPLEEALQLCFENQSLTWSVVGKTIVVKPAIQPNKPSHNPGGAKTNMLVLRAESSENSTSLHLQEITGKVTDEKGDVLPGVSIVIKGTSTGTVTNESGNFLLNTTVENPTLVFSFVGYQSLEINTRGKNVLDIVLPSDTKALEEVIVIGYTSKQTSQLTSSISTVSGKQLNDVTSNNPLSLLQGKAPGVIVSNPSGDPTASSNVVIRGSSSITAGSGPLMVVDGIIGGNANPNDIETITILKDAAATGLYGSRAANGVIIITTKSGKSGKTRISLNASTGFNNATTGNFRVMNSQELYDYEKSFYPADRFDREIPASVANQNTNWQDLAFRTGITQNYVLSVSGGTDKTKFYVAGNFYNEEGTLRFNEAKKYNLRTNLNHKINEKFSLNIKLNSYFNQFQSDPSGLDGALYGAYNNMPWDKPYNTDGSVNRGTEGGWYGREQENFLHGWQYNLNQSKSTGIDADVNLEYKIIPDLTFYTYNRVSYGNSRGDLYHDIRSKAGKGLGRLTDSFGNRMSLITSNRLKYDKIIGNHQITALAVAEAEKNRIENNEFTGEGFAPGLHVMSTASRILTGSGDIFENAFSKGLAQLDYSYDNRYFGVVSYINESSSRFGANRRSGNFYTLGASWILSNENFMSNSSAIDLLKLRASYGLTGNAEIGNYQSLGLYSFAAQYAGNSAAFPSQLANKDLTWEKAKTLNFGVDLNILKRISLNVDLYKKTTDGLLLNVELPYTSGFASVIRNVGAVQNKGLEVNLSTINLKGAFRWESGFNIAFNRSKVLQLVDGKDIRQGNLLISEGQELYTWNMRKWASVDAENGDPLWEVVNTDANGNEVRSTTNSYSNATLQNVGSAAPDFTGGFSNTFSYKRFTLSAFMNFVSGNKVYHTSRGLFDSDGAYFTYNSMVLADNWSRWEKPGDIATHPKAVFGGNRNSNQTSSRYLEDGSYLRLRNINLSYDIPSGFLNRFKIADMKIYVSGDNLVTLTQFSGMDPEVSLGPGGGISSIKYPISKKVLFGINLTF